MPIKHKIEQTDSFIRDGFPIIVLTQRRTVDQFWLVFDPALCRFVSSEMQ